MHVYHDTIARIIDDKRLSLSRISGDHYSKGTLIGGLLATVVHKSIIYYQISGLKLDNN